MTCILIFMLIACPGILRSQVKSIRIIADTTGAWFLDGQLRSGVLATFESGKKRRTTGYLNGNLPWKKIIMTSDQAVISKGMMKVDLQKVIANNNTLTIEARLKSDERVKTRIDIRIPPLRRLDLIIPGENGVAPGSSFTPELFFLFSNGIQYTCNPWDKKSFISGEEISLFYGKQKVEDGVVKIPSDILETGEIPVVSAVWNRNTEIFDLEQLNLSFPDVETLMFNESVGADGKNGSNGLAGQDGLPGFEGGRGGDARDLKMCFWLDKDSSLLHVSTTYEGMMNSFVLKPGKSMLNISLRGGNGGKGGQGGEGGTTHEIDETDLGAGGPGGQGGAGGRGGAITIYCEEEAEKYLPQLRIDNSGGWGGEGGKGGKGGNLIINGQSLMESLFFPARKPNGPDGSPGADGQNGPEANILLMTEPEVIGRCK